MFHNFPFHVAIHIVEYVKNGLKPSIWSKFNRGKYLIHLFQVLLNLLLYYFFAFRFLNRLRKSRPHIPRLHGHVVYKIFLNMKPFLLNQLPDQQ